VSRTVVVLATLDTKGEEADYLRRRIEAQGARALLVDLGVVGEPQVAADVTREQVAAAGGADWAALAAAPTREASAPIMATGATALLLPHVRRGTAHAVLGIGGTQGTSLCTSIMRALPYGFPKLMVSTVASGDTSAFVGVKDIMMMFSVSDLMGLNRFTERILANAAAAACGIAEDGRPVDTGDGRPLVGMTNLGVLTAGASLAVDLLREAGCDVLVFHAVGSGGRAMEQLMKDGVVTAVFDYALGEIADEVFGGLRAGGAERLTVAGALGLPQVICPGGAEHLGLFVAPHTVPEMYRHHRHVFHSPVIFVPRLNREEIVRVAGDICRRLRHTTGRAVLMLPLRGVGRYSVPGGPLHDPASDAAFFAALKAGLPAGIEVVEVDAGAEDPAFVREAVRRLVAMLAPAS
jgi:uncharacterized protein (UPF0261 family)